MAGIAYILDTNVISDLLKRNVNVEAHLHAVLSSGDIAYICQPVYYEILRGLLWAGATSKQRIFKEKILPRFQWISLVDDDWARAAQLWASTVSAGRQLADIDLLIAAIALRANAVLVSSDHDFDALSVKRVNWRDV
jgi:tRNA(fMet)-specific endonuclease VapC